MKFLLLASILTSLFKTFNKRNCTSPLCVMERIIPLGLALLYRYSPRTLDNIFKFSFITVVVVVFLFFILFSFFYSKITCSLYFCCCSKMFFYYCAILLSEINLLTMGYFSIKARKKHNWSGECRISRYHPFALKFVKAAVSIKCGPWCVWWKSSWIQFHYFVLWTSRKTNWWPKSETITFDQIHQGWWMQSIWYRIVVAATICCLWKCQ